MIGRVQTTLKDEKFKHDLKPIVIVEPGLGQIQYTDLANLVVTVVIINSHSFIRLKINSEKVLERIQRAIRKDIIDVMLRDKELEFIFHSIRTPIALKLGSFKEARELQEAVHAIRNSPMFPRLK